MKTRAWGAVVLAGAMAILSGCLPREEGGCPYCPGGGVAVIVPFETVDQGDHSGIRGERRVVVRDGAAWAALWAEHGAGRTPPPELPEVDFSREMVVGFFWGEKPTAGYRVEISEVLAEAGRLVVRVEVGSPPPGAPVVQVLTQPHHLVRLPRSELPVEFLVVERGASGAEG